MKLKIRYANQFAKHVACHDGAPLIIELGGGGGGGAPVASTNMVTACVSLFREV